MCVNINTHIYTYTKYPSMSDKELKESLTIFVIWAPYLDEMD